MTGTAYRRSLGRPRGAGSADRTGVPGGTLERVSPGLGPLVLILLVAGALMLVTRWAFGRGYGRSTPPPTGDQGLLVMVATVSSPETARALRAVLSDAGIRSTQRSPAPHRTDVLVFPDDADRARALAVSFGR